MRILYVKIVILLFIVSCSKIVVKQNGLRKQTFPNWTMYGGNSQRTNTYPGSIDLPLKLVWQKKISSAIDKTILVVDSIIYFSTQSNEVNAYHIGTGKKVGKKEVDFASTCAYNNHRLIVASRYGDNTLFDLDLNRSKYNWKVDAGDIASEPLITTKSVIVTALYNHIDLYTADTGTKIWTFKTNDQIRSSPALADGKVIFGSDDGMIYAISESNGDLIWSFETGASVQSMPAIDSKRKQVFIGSSDRIFYTLSLDSGKEIWHFSTNGQILNGAAISNNKVIFGSTDRKIYCLNSKNGELLWQVVANSVISTNPLIAGDIVFWGSLDHNFYAADINTGKILWQHEAKGRIRSTPVVWGNYFIGSSEDNYLYIFKTEKHPNLSEL